MTDTHTAAGHDDEHHVNLHPSLPVRILLWLAGSVALVLAVIGIVVPGLPTTPFVLVAAACYARASRRFYFWLVHNPTFGPLIREWRLHRSIPWRIKLIAIGTMSLTIGVSIWSFAGKPWLQGMLAFIGVSTALWLWRIPSRDRPQGRRGA
ncbi:MAG: YbaN family protein [Rhodocyclaceae bacterium]|jgi:hypothetical protein|nr:YbaN family protein [Rhodocyclaceae bacterium]